MKAFNVCSFVVDLKGEAYVWGQPFKDMENENVFWSPEKIELSESSKITLKQSDSGSKQEKNISNLSDAHE